MKLIQAKTHENILRGMAMFSGFSAIFTRGDYLCYFLFAKIETLSIRKTKIFGQSYLPCKWFHSSYQRLFIIQRGKTWEKEFYYITVVDKMLLLLSLEYEINWLQNVIPLCYYIRNAWYGILWIIYILRRTNTEFA